MRLVGEQAEAQAGEPGPAVDQERPERQERGGEEAVLAVGQVAEHQRMGERDPGRVAPAAAKRIAPAKTASDRAVQSQKAGCGSRLAKAAAGIRKTGG